MNIKDEDIPYNLHQMVEITGLDEFKKISKMYGGSSIYIPVYKKVIMGHRNRAIVKEYNGKNLDDLRKKYKISEKQIKNILKNKGN